MVTSMHRALPILVAALGLATACGPTPPDYKTLATLKVTGVCGKTFTADKVVHAAYDDTPLGSLPNPQPVPGGTIVAAGQAALTATISRTIPCATDVGAGAKNLGKLGFTGVKAAGSGTYLFLYTATDPYGIPGDYAVFKCSFVGNLSQDLTGQYVSQGLHGTFGPDVGPIVDAASVKTFAALTFRTQTTQLAYVSTLPAYQDRPPVFLAMEPDLVDRSFSGTTQPSLGLCATWIVPNFSGGCDTVAVGIAFNVLTDDKGGFQQYPLTPSPVEMYQGYCGRTQ